MFRVCLQLALILWATSALSQALPPLAADARVPWRAVGIINSDGVSGLAQCSGALVAPDLVLTAAHCAGSSAGPFESRHFVLGGAGSGPDRVFTSSNITLHPSYADASSDLERFGVDLALMTLSRSVPPGTAAPLPFIGLGADAPEGGVFAVLGFDRLRPEQLNGRFDCFPARPTDAAALRLRCPVTNGNSGGPVLVETAQGWKIIGVAAARVGRGQGAQTLVALGDDWLAQRIQDALTR